jgi:hypothetical protein
MNGSHQNLALKPGMTNPTVRKSAWIPVSISVKLLTEPVKERYVAFAPSEESLGRSAPMMRG